MRWNILSWSSALLLAAPLVSITCNDACNVAQDIAEATLKTDDRSFQLRAQRSGAGAGRTYTITQLRARARETRPGSRWK